MGFNSAFKGLNMAARGWPGGGGGLFYLQDFVSGILYVNSDLHCLSRFTCSRAPRFAFIACSSV